MKLSSGQITAMISASLCMLSVGMLAASLGPALPDLAARTGYAPASLGGLFTAFFLGALLSVASAGALVDRFSQGRVLLAGGLLAGAGTGLLTVAGSLPAMLAAATLTGLGQGAVDLASNVAVAKRFADRSVTVLNLLNIFFGVGAMVGPALAGFMLRGGGSGLWGLWAGAGIMLLAGLLAAAIPSPAGEASAQTAPAAPLPFRSPLLWNLGFLMLFTVGTQTGLGGWATTYLTGTTHLERTEAAWVTSGYWLASTVGRLLGAGLGTRLAPDRLLGLFLATTALGGMLLVASTGSAALSVTAILIMGFGYGPIFPTMVGLTTSTFREAPGTAGSFVMSLGTVGSMLLPWLQGVLLDGAGPRASVGLIAAGTLCMLGLLRLVRSVQLAPIPDHQG